MGMLRFGILQFFDLEESVAVDQILTADSIENDELDRVSIRST